MLSRWSCVDKPEHRRGVAFELFEEGFAGEILRCLRATCEAAEFFETALDSYPISGESPTLELRAVDAEF